MMHILLCDTFETTCGMPRWLKDEIEAQTQTSTTPLLHAQVRADQNLLSNSHVIFTPKDTPVKSWIFAFDPPSHLPATVTSRK